MIYVHWILLIVYIAIVILTMVKVLMDNRQPTKTMAWLLVLLFIPFIGIIIYFFFGQNTRKERYISQHSLDQISKRSMAGYVEQRNLQIPEQHKVLVRLFAEQNWAFPYTDNDVDIFTDGYSFLSVLLYEIGKARHHIHLISYIIEDDPVGRLVADALMDKARQGIEVRLIYDDVGCWRVKKAFFEQMRDAGIDVHAFMPVHFPIFTSKVNYRNHRKICVIDGKVGFIGGMNIAFRYVKGTAKQTWRDTHLRIKGRGVYGLQKAFLVDWYFVDRSLIGGLKYYPIIEHTQSNSCIAQVVTSSPIAEWPDIMQGYVRIILEARKYVFIETPYFLPTEPVLFAMRTAALAGVDVRLLVPMHPDTRLAKWASHSYMTETIKSGIKVYFYKPGFNHSKLLICDDSLCTCGSTNVDFRSFENNFESNIFFYDEQMALRMKQVFLDDLANSVLMNGQLRVDRRPFLVRLWESLIRLLAPLL